MIPKNQNYGEKKGELFNNTDLDSKIITNYNIDDTDNQADYNSLKADWDAVGKDLRSAFDQYAR